MTAGVTMTGGGPIKAQPPADRLDPRWTRPQDVYLIGHLGIATVAPAGWSLRVDGLVDRPLTLGLDELRGWPSVDVDAVLECFGNPLAPDVPVHRAAQLRWRGVPVAALLDAAGPHAGAGTVWASGLDHGEFAGETCTEYRKDLPLAVLRERGIVAHTLDGGPLPTERGFPARLVVPGFFGTNNVKWLGAITVADRRPEHLFSTRLYLRPGPHGRPVPVREIDPNAIVTTPADGATVPRDTEISGWAWSLEPVVAAEVLVDGVPTAAGVEPRGGGVTWQRFRAPVRLAPGEREIAVRVTDAEGRTQPGGGARNAWHRIRVRAA